MPFRKRMEKIPPISKKPYVVHFNGSTLYYTKSEMTHILNLWDTTFGEKGTFMTGLGMADWQRRDSDT